MQMRWALNPKHPNTKPDAAADEISWWWMQMRRAGGGSNALDGLVRLVVDRTHFRDSC